MSQYVNLEMSYYTYSNLCDAVMEATAHAEGFFEIQELVHLFDFLEEEYERDIQKRNENYKTWRLHEELFRNKETYHHQYFHAVKKVLDKYEDKELFEWNISEQEKFHLICELIDVFKNDSNNSNNM